jgi:hypothetical protein
MVRQIATCAYRKSSSHIQMMKSAKKWRRPKMRPTACTVHGDGASLLTERCCEPSYNRSRKIAADRGDAVAEHDNVVKTFPPGEPIARSQYPFCHGDRGALAHPEFHDPNLQRWFVRHRYRA